MIIQLLRSTTQIFFAGFDNFIKNSKEETGFEIFLWIYRALIYLV